MICDCAALEEARERIAWLESELGLRRSAENRVALRAAMTPSAHGVPGVNLVIALYAAKGRTMSRWQLLEAIQSPSGREDRDAKTIDVWVSGARKGLGRDAIETVWGHGYRLTAEGLSRVSAILGEAG